MMRVKQLTDYLPRQHVRLKSKLNSRGASMNDPVLVINCGSSSIKYALVPAAADQPRLTGLAERLVSADARLKGVDSRGEAFTRALGDAGHVEALAAILEGLGDHRPGAVGHRVVHGGERFRSEEHTSELQSRPHLVCRLLLEKKKRARDSTPSTGCRVIAR